MATKTSSDQVIKKLVGFLRKENMPEGEIIKALVSLLEDANSRNPKRCAKSKPEAKGAVAIKDALFGGANDTYACHYGDGQCADLTQDQCNAIPGSVWHGPGGPVVPHKCPG
jgi:hypothetical protein